MPECRVHRGTELLPVYETPPPCEFCGVTPSAVQVGWKCIIASCKEPQAVIEQPKVEPKITLADVRALHTRNGELEAEAADLSAKLADAARNLGALKTELEAIKAAVASAPPPPEPTAA